MTAARAAWWWLAAGLHGCAFAPQLPKVSDALSPEIGAPEVRLAEVRDLRSETTVGTVGLGTFKLGSEAPTYLHRGMVNRLRQQGFVVRDASDRSAVSARVVTVTLQSLTLSTSDALVEPAEAEGRCEVEISDGSGRRVYQQRYRGSASERLDSRSLIVQKAVGRILADVMDQMADEAVKDPDFQAAIR